MAEKLKRSKSSFQPAPPQPAHCHRRVPRAQLPAREGLGWEGCAAPKANRRLRQGGSWQVISGAGVWSVNASGLGTEPW